MDISVFGIGYVGAVSAVCLAKTGHNVIAVDINPEKVAMINLGYSPVVEPSLEYELRQAIDCGRLKATTDYPLAMEGSEISLVCVGTPSLDEGNFDLTQIRNVCAQIGKSLSLKNSFHVIVIRSTLLPGSLSEIVKPILEAASGKVCGRNFGLAFYPEFLREGTAIEDYFGAETILLGCNDKKAEVLLRKLMVGLRGEILVTDPATAEMVKLTNNAWHATKIVFANEIGAFCHVLGIDSHDVMRILCFDNRLNMSPAYLRPGFAYGGSCLPKDLRALQYRAKSVGVKLPLLRALPQSNDLIIERVIDLVKAEGESRVGIIGLAYKIGTDDLRESPAVILAERLLGKGYRLSIFDRMVSSAQVSDSNKSYFDSHYPHLKKLLTDNLQSIFDHADILILVHDDFGEFKFPTLRPEQLLIDVARVPGAESAGARYVGICW